MRKAVKLYALMGVLLVICAAVFFVSRYEEKQEQIKASGEIILQLATDTVTSVRWENETGTFSFTKDDGWSYDDDAAFPVDDTKIDAMLAQFEQLSAAFVIEDAEDLSQYGLDEPVCTITLGTQSESCTVTLGAISKMDAQRYLSLGDGNAYLVDHDPLDEFSAVLSDVILHDTLPEFTLVDQLSFAGAETYTIDRSETTASLCEDDIYFTDGKPLDSASVEEYVDTLTRLSLDSYVSYNVTEEELQTFGLDAPELSVTVNWRTEAADEDSADETGSFTVHLSRNPEELAAYDEAVAAEEDELPAVTCYARVGTSQIVYSISQTTFDALMDAGYDALRHQTLFTADFSCVTAIDVTLSGETASFTCVPADTEDEEAASVWMYQDAQQDISEIRSTLCSLSATSFTEETAARQEELSVTLHLDNEAFETFTLTLYRYDGESCLAEIDGSPVAFVSRAQAVDLIEAFNAILLAPAA